MKIRQCPDPRAEELVKRVEPTARVEPYGGGFAMRKLAIATVSCPCCGHVGPRPVSVNMFSVLFVAGTPALVWHNAAVEMGLLEDDGR